MLLDLKLPKVQRGKPIQVVKVCTDGSYLTQAPNPFFYAIVPKSEVKSAIEKIRRLPAVVDVYEVPKVPVVRVSGSRYEPRPDKYVVLKVETQAPTDVPDVAATVPSLVPDARCSMFNVRYLCRAAWSMDVTFFGVKPLYYCFDTSLGRRLREVKALIIDVEVVEGKPVIASTMWWTVDQEYRRDDVQTWELPQQLDELCREIGRARIIAGHNVLGFDIPVLKRFGAVICTDLVSIFDTSQVLASWGQSLALGTARALHEVAKVLKDAVGVTDEELELKMRCKGKVDKLSREELARYNANDVVLTAKVMKPIFTFVATLSAYLQMPMSIVQTLTAGLVAEYFLVREMELRGYVPEYRAVKWDAAASRVWLLRAKTLWRSVLQLDIDRMYPSYVIANNVDPTLIVEEPPTTARDVATVSEEDIDLVRFDRYSGLGFVLSAVKKLNIVRNMTKRMKKTSPMYEYIDHAVKAVLNALAYGAQGKQASPTPMGNVACPAKIFLGTYKIQMSVINELRARGFNVVYSDTDSFFISDVPSDRVSEVEKVVNDVLARYGMVAKVEEWWEEMFIYSKKSYICRKGEKVLIKGSPIKQKLKFYLPRVVTDHFMDLLRCSDVAERRKLLREIIDSADVEDLFANPANQLYRLLGKDYQSAKREIKKRGKVFLKVYTPWEMPRTIYLKKAPIAQLCRPDHAPLINLLMDSPEIDLRDYEGYLVLEATCLPLSMSTMRNPLQKVVGRGRLLMYRGGTVYKVDLEDFRFVLVSREGKVYKVTPPKTADLVGYFVLARVEAKVRAEPVKVAEDVLRNAVYAYCLELLSRMNLV